MYKLNWLVNKLSIAIFISTFTYNYLKLHLRIASEICNEINKTEQVKIIN